MSTLPALAQAASSAPALTPQQIKVLNYASRGASIEATAGAMMLSPHTVKTHRAAICHLIGADHFDKAVAALGNRYRLSAATLGASSSPAAGSTGRAAPALVKDGAGAPPPTIDVDGFLRSLAYTAAQPTATALTELMRFTTDGPTSSICAFGEEPAALLATALLRTLRLEMHFPAGPAELAAAEKLMGALHSFAEIWGRG